MVNKRTILSLILDRISFFLVKGKIWWASRFTWNKQEQPCKMFSKSLSQQVVLLCNMLVAILLSCNNGVVEQLQLGVNLAITYVEEPCNQLSCWNNLFTTCTLTCNKLFQPCQQIETNNANTITWYWLDGAAMGIVIILIHSCCFVIRSCEFLHMIIPCTQLTKGLIIVGYFWVCKDTSILFSLSLSISINLLLQTYHLVTNSQFTMLFLKRNPTRWEWT